jgi:hypothetical protein
MSVWALDKFNWVSVTIAGKTVRLRRFLGPYQWALILSLVGVIIYAWSNYRSSTEQARKQAESSPKTAESRLAISRYQHESWKKFRTFLLQTVIQILQVVSNQTTDEILKLIDRFCHSFKNAETLGKAADNFFGMCDYDEFIHVTMAESEEPAAKPAPKQTPKKKAVKPPIKQELADAKLAASLQKVENAKAPHKPSANGEDEEKYPTTPAVPLVQKPSAKAKAIEKAKAALIAEGYTKAAQADDSDSDDEKEETSAQKVKRFFSPLWAHDSDDELAAGGYDILGTDLSVPWSSPAYVLHPPTFGERVYFQWRRLTGLFSRANLYYYARLPLVYINQSARSSWRMVHDNYRVTFACSLLAAVVLLSVFLRNRAARFSESHSEDGGTGNKRRKKEAKKALKAAHNPYQKQKDAEYEKQKAERQEREREEERARDEAEELERQLLQRADNDAAHEQAMEEKAFQRELDAADEDAIERDLIERESGSGFTMKIHDTKAAARRANRRGEVKITPPKFPLPEPESPPRRKRSNKKKAAEADKPRDCFQFFKSGACNRTDCPYTHKAGPKPTPKVCWEWSQDNKCKRGDKCFLASTHVARSAEQLIPGSVVLVDIPMFEVESEDQAKRVARANAHITHDTVIIPRHLVAGKTRVTVLQGGARFDMPAKAYICKSMPDQCWYRKPAGLKMCAGVKYRAPTVGEPCGLNWMASGTVRRTTGKVVSEDRLGAERKIVAFSYDGSTLAGSCGAVYTSHTDGALIGVHGVGADVVGVKPQFFGINKGWVHELTSWQDKESITVADDKAYGNGSDKLEWHNILNNKPINLLGGQ